MCLKLTKAMIQINQETEKIAQYQLIELVLQLLSSLLEKKKLKKGLYCF